MSTAGELQVRETALRSPALRTVLLPGRGSSFRLGSSLGHRFLVAILGATGLLFFLAAWR